MHNVEKLFNDKGLKKLPRSSFNVSISSEEYEEMVKYRPVVSFEEWVKYRNMSEKELFELFPIVKILEPNITVYEVFFYATRLWLPTFPQIGKTIKRWEQYSASSIEIKELYDKLYAPNEKDSIKRQKTYTLAPPHPLEFVILSFEKGIGVSQLLNSTSQRYGFGELDVDAISDFYFRLDDYITETKASLDTIIPTFKKFSLIDLLHLNQKEYSNYVENLPMGMPVLDFKERVYGQLFI